MTRSQNGTVPFLVPKKWWCVTVCVCVYNSLNVIANDRSFSAGSPSIDVSKVVVQPVIIVQEKLTHAKLTTIELRPCGEPLIYVETGSILRNWSALLAPTADGRAVEPSSARSLKLSNGEPGQCLDGRPLLKFYTF